MICNICGRQVEESFPGSGQPMPCRCISKVLPSLELEDEQSEKYDDTYELDRKLCMDQDDDKEYRKGLR